MSTLAVARPTPSPLQMRLSRLAALTSTEIETLQVAERDQRRWPARREIIAEGDVVRAPRAILSGWACRQRILSNGRRQILSVLLPGDLIGMCRQRNPVASTSILAVTDVVICPTPEAEGHGGLADAYALSAALEQYYLLAQITRLGRLDARERLAGWCLETQERLALAGLASDDRFPMPLTQEFLADTLGLTSIHVNRTLQALRRDELLNSRGGWVSLINRGRLEDTVGYRAARVSSVTEQWGGDRIEANCAGAQ